MEKLPATLHRVHTPTSRFSCGSVSPQPSLTAGTFTSTVMGWEAPLPLPLLMVVLKVWVSVTAQQTAAGHSTAVGNCWPLEPAASCALCCCAAGRHGRVGHALSPPPTHQLLHGWPGEHA